VDHGITTAGEHRPFEGNSSGSEGFLEVRLPEHFIVEAIAGNGKWLAANSYLREDCERQADGSYVCGGRGGGSPQWIRCVAHLPDSFIHLDGGGRPWRYRLTAVEDESRESDSSTPRASMFEVSCQCGAVLTVFSRSTERPRVQCPRCGAHADAELPTGEPWDEAGFDETGPDVQVRVAWAPRD
jgi:ribosomal protein S27E